MSEPYRPKAAGEPTRAGVLVKALRPAAPEALSPSTVALFIEQRYGRDCPVPAGLAADAAREGAASGRPAAGGDWTAHQLAREFACSVNTVLDRIGRGEFGPPGQPGGPFQEPHARGKGRWWVPDEQVAAYRSARRLRGESPTLIAGASSSAPPARGRAGSRVTATLEERAHLKVS